ncbi:hypothetical protein N0V83_007834 [Neocucurbitaria cava]|uniref:Uncharacterized protein n=1 Tax=Neocucurbitaria cava TaxID=798079 RepID=A0A9W8Y3J6_9PLEO|nr:hypothetical protein N0V83_007834 [Neocucurbitaria cava]
MHEPMVLQALLALSSAHKRKILEPAKRARDGLLPDTQEIFLLKQYGGAIKNMQELLADENRPTRPRLLLTVIMCSLFVLLEYMRGNYETGYLHLTSGAQLAKQLSIEPTSETMCEIKLVHFFAQLQNQSDMYRLQKQRRSQSSLSASPESQKTSTALPATTTTIIPTKTALRFANVAEAGSHLDALTESIVHSTEQARMIPLSAKASRRLLAQEHAYVLASFDAWLLAYHATIAAQPSPESEVDRAGWKGLRQRYDMAMEMADLGVTGRPVEEMEDGGDDSGKQKRGGGVGGEGRKFEWVRSGRNEQMNSLKV